MKKTLAAIAVSMVLSTSALAENTTLRMSTWASPNHPINSEVLTEWSKDVNEATNGRVTVELLYDIAPPPRQMEAVADEVADIGWIFHGFNPGRFLLTKVAEFPLADEYTAEQISVAYWKTHETYLQAANEHQGLKVLGVGAHGPGQLFTIDQISEFSDVAGTKIRVGGGVMSDVAGKLGVNQVAMPTPAVYQAISQGVVDGTFLAVETLRSMNLVEVSPYVYYVPGGMYGGTFSVFMNSGSWDNLSAEDQAAIESVSGEHLSRLFGSVMQHADELGLEYALQNGGVLTQATDSDVAQIAEISEEMKQEWLAATQEQYEVDSKAALEFFNEQLDAQK